MADKTPAGGEPSRPELPPELPGQLLWRYVAWALVISAFMYYYWSSSPDTGARQTISYSEFKDKVRADTVAKVTLQGDRVTGVYRTGTAADTTKTKTERTIQPSFSTTLPSMNDPELMPLLEKHQVNIEAKSQEAPWWLQALIAFVPWIFIFALFYFASRKLSERFAQGGSLFGFSKSKARLYSKGTMNLSFNDVAGLENAKADLREISTPTTACPPTPSRALCRCPACSIWNRSCCLRKGPTRRSE